MARILDSYDFPRAGRPPFTVPDEWLDGKIHALDQDVDYEAGREKSLKNAVVKAGAAKNLKVVVDISKAESDKVIVIQAFPKPPKVTKPVKEKESSSSSPANGDAEKKKR